jgi:hypothetical protein
MITQRPQVLNKDVLTQADMLVALRMNHPKDLAAVKEWVDVHSDPAAAKEMIQSLPSLPIGTAWFWAPGSELMQKTKVRLRETFDSSATPKPGQRVKAPKALATVDIEELGAEISATVQRAKENSPAELKAKIRKLEGELQAKATTSPATVDSQTSASALASLKHSNADLKAQNVELKTRLADVRRKAEKLHTFVDAQVWPMLEKLKSGIVDIDVAMGIIRSATDVAIPIEPNRPVVPARPTPVARVALISTPESINSGNGDKKLTGASLKIAGVAAAYGRRGEGITKKLLATLCGVSSGGSFSSRLSEARTAGAITTDGTMVYATPEGTECYAGAFKAPETTEEVAALWRSRLTGTARTIFDHLISLEGQQISRQQLADAVGVSSGGSFSSRLSEVRSTGLLVEGGGNIAVNPKLLFL